MADKKKIPKKQKLRNAEYYDMQSVFDKLYADSKKGRIFTYLVEIIKKSRKYQAGIQKYA